LVQYVEGAEFNKARGPLKLLATCHRAASARPAETLGHRAARAAIDPMRRVARAAVLLGLGCGGGADVVERPQRCVEREILRSATVRLAAGENATVALDVAAAVADDERVTATVRASARGDFGGDAATATVGVAGAAGAVACGGGGASQCTAWHACAGAAVVAGAPAIAAAVALGPGVDWDYCAGATVAEVAVEAVFVAQRCGPKPASGRRRPDPRRFATRVAAAAVALSAAGFFAAALCLARAWRDQARRDGRGAALPTKGRARHWPRGAKPTPRGGSPDSDAFLIDAAEADGAAAATRV